MFPIFFIIFTSECYFYSLNYSDPRNHISWGPMRNTMDCFQSLHIHLHFVKCFVFGWFGILLKHFLRFVQHKCVWLIIKNVKWLFFPSAAPRCTSSVKCFGLGGFYIKGKWLPLLSWEHVTKCFCLILSLRPNACLIAALIGRAKAPCPRPNCCKTSFNIDH